jgi:hypothetical protein
MSRISANTETEHVIHSHRQNVARVKLVPHTPRPKSAPKPMPRPTPRPMPKPTPKPTTPETWDRYAALSLRRDARDLRIFYRSLATLYDDLSAPLALRCGKPECAVCNAEFAADHAAIFRGKAKWNPITLRNVAWKEDLCKVHECIALQQSRYSKIRSFGDTEVLSIDDILCYMRDGYVDREVLQKLAKHTHFRHPADDHVLDESKREQYGMRRMAKILWDHCGMDAYKYAREGNNPKMAAAILMCEKRASISEEKAPRI